jgi:excisionase family DNA binding protein
VAELFLKGITVEEFLRMIDQAIDRKFGGMQKPPMESHKNLYYSRKEVARMLQISLPTLNDWTKLGWLKSYKIGNRVLYKREEVEEAVTHSSIKKNQKGTS